MEAAREIAAAASALGAYLTTVLPRVRRELRTWGPLPREKAKNAEAVAVFATLAPPSARAAVVRATVALQIAIDYRDTLEEKSGAWARPDGDAYLGGLEQTWRREVAALPAYTEVAALLERAVERCAQGQLHTHAAAHEAIEPLRAWASAVGDRDDYRWWEIAAGASSSVAAHALIAAASRDVRGGDAAAIDAAYNPPVGALTVLLDDLVDLAPDRAAGEHNYVDYYASPDEMGERLASIARHARVLIEPLPQARRHQAILAGVAAFYLSDPGADLELGASVRAKVLAAFGPGARLLSNFMRLRQARERKRPGQAGNSSGP